MRDIVRPCSRVRTLQTTSHSPGVGTISGCVDAMIAVNVSSFIADDSNGTLPLISDYDYAGRPETYIVPVLFAVIFVVGTIGNGTLVLIFVRHKQMRNVPNIYILNLALGDLLVIISCVPFTSTVYTVRLLDVYII